MDVPNDAKADPVEPERSSPDCEQGWIRDERLDVCVPEQPIAFQFLRVLLAGEWTTIFWNPDVPWWQRLDEIYIAPEQPHPPPPVAVSTDVETGPIIGSAIFDTSQSGQAYFPTAWESATPDDGRNLDG